MLTDGGSFSQTLPSGGRSLQEGSSDGSLASERLILKCPALFDGHGRVYIKKKNKGDYHGRYLCCDTCRVPAHLRCRDASVIIRVRPDLHKP